MLRLQPFAKIFLVLERLSAEPERTEYCQGGCRDAKYHNSVILHPLRRNSRSRKPTSTCPPFALFKF